MVRFSIDFIAADQYNWLERDLGDVDREVTPWLVAAWQTPWYSTYLAHYREAECMRVEMEDLLYNYGVDIVFNGQVRVLVVFLSRFLVSKYVPLPYAPSLFSLVVLQHSV